MLSLTCRTSDLDSAASAIGLAYLLTHFPATHPLSLPAGTVIVTGSCTGYVEAPRGEAVVARFPALGGASVSMRFGAGPA